MRTYHPQFFIPLALLALGAGCTATTHLTAQPSPGTVALPAANLVSQVLGTVSAPSTLISNNAGSLISNNSGSLISNNAGGYRVAANAGVPRSLLYLSTPDEQLYTLDGQSLTTTTDSLGQYRFERKIPKDLHVIVNAMLPENRRLVGYGLSRDGDLQVDVNLATTYVVEFLRYQAKKAGKTFKDYDLTKLAQGTTLTQALDTAGTLPIPDLTIGYANRLSSSYIAAFGAYSRELSDYWKALLGSRPIAMTTLAGSYSLGYAGDGGAAARATLGKTSGVAAFKGADHQVVYWLADEGNHLLRKVLADGTIMTAAGTSSGDPTTQIPLLSSDNGSGFAAPTGGIPWPRALTVDAVGNVIFSPNNTSSPYNTDFHVVLVLCNVSGSYYGRTMVAGNVYRLGAPTSDTLAAKTRTQTYGYRGDGAPAFSTTAGAWAQFRYIPGLTLNATGDIYLTDQISHAVRRIDRATGIITKVAGTPGSGGFTGDGGDAKLCKLFYPTGIAYRQGTGSTEELYVVDGSNQRIRKIWSTDGFATATISTFVGDGKQLNDVDGKLAASTSIDVGELPTPGGIAIDPVRRQLYFVQPNQGLVKAVDLDTTIVRTVAGGGLNDREGEAKDCRLTAPTHLAIAPDGSLLLSDRDNFVFRRIHLQFGE